MSRKKQKVRRRVKRRFRSSANSYNSNVLLGNSKSENVCPLFLHPFRRTSPAYERRRRSHRNFYCPHVLTGTSVTN